MDKNNHLHDMRYDNPTTLTITKTIRFLASSTRSRTLTPFPSLLLILPTTNRHLLPLLKPQTLI